MQNLKYKDYKSTDFLNDIDFIRAIKNQDTEKINYWQQLIRDNVINKDVYEQAVYNLQIILSAAPIEPGQDFVNKLKNRIDVSIADQRRLQTAKIRMLIIRTAAAACLLLCTGIYWFYHSVITEKTTFGEVRRLYLPDGTQVILNAGSTLTYPRALGYGRERKVVLKGEAYFNVVHLNRNQAHIKAGERFIVGTQELNLEVLGTEFNIKSRRGNTIIYLVKGKVRVTRQNRSHLMVSGNRFDATQNKISNPVYSRPSTSWIEKQMLLHNTSLQEVANNFEDVFGKKLVIPSTLFKQKAFDGLIEMQNEQNTLFIISTLLHAKITQQGNIIYLTPSTN